MRVLDEFEPKEVTNLVSLPKSIKQVLNEFLDVMPEELPDELPREDKLTMRSRWCRKWHLPPRPHIEWIIRSWKSLRFNLRNSPQKDTSNLTSHLMEHSSFLFTRRTGRWGCAWIIKPSTRWQWRIDTHCLELMICLINFQELKCLVGLTYVRGITKFGLQKGTKKRSFVAQGMVHMSSWWCLLDSRMHLPHFAPSWITFSDSGLMILWSST